MQSVITVDDAFELFSPPTLLQLCTQFCASNPNHVLFRKGNKLKLKRSVGLPTPVWENLLDNLDRANEEYLPMISEIFQNTILRKINVSNCSNLTDEDLRAFLKHFPYSLDIHNCPLLTKQSLTAINEFGKNLECLIFGNSVHVLPTDIDNWMAKHNEGLQKLAEVLGRLFMGKPIKTETESKVKPGILKTPNLRKLVIWGHYVHQFQIVREERSGQDVSSGAGVDNREDRSSVDFWEYLTRDFISNLEYLDLSGCHEVKNLNFLLKAKATLKFLYLHDVLLDYNELTWGTLKYFNELKFLDVSQYNELASVFPNPDAILESIVTSLPNLMGLDISGSNLAGFGTNDVPRPTTRSGIKGLKCRDQKWLQFLGLLASHYSASGRESIPAVRITGGSNIVQIVASMKCYIHRSNMIRKVVRILHEKLQDAHLSEFVPCYTILDLLSQVIKLHIEDKHTLIISFAAVFYILTKIYDGWPICRSEKLIEKCRRDKLFHLTNRAMNIHYQDMSLLRNGILNIHLLFLHITTPDISYANAILPTLFMAGKTAIESSLYSTDSFSFFIQSIPHLADFLMDANCVKQVTSVDCIAKMCEIIHEMFDKKISSGRDIAMYWRLLLKWLGVAIDVDVCSRFVYSDGVEACLLLFKMCTDEETPEGNPVNDLLIPVIVFLMNLLNNFPIFESDIITPTLLSKILTILASHRNRSYREMQLLRHVCCGFIATTASKKLSYSLKNPSRSELLEVIFKSMRGKEYTPPIPFKFRNFQPLYDLLEVQNAPEIHVWALQTILVLIEADADSVISNIENDCRINVDSIHQQLIYKDMDEDCRDEVKRLCDRLVKVVQKFRILTAPENDKSSDV